ncbi:MAG TPA: SpoIIE family protein phosphatase, partial [Acidobacteriota bacterium]|nr:SpoIIE family protein phosphatase [Acidobacteriota bacterium]
MNRNDCFLEVDFSQQWKHGQDICGDTFYCYKTSKDGRVIVVLSDGLGSGVKANILASMTTRMAAQFAASDLDFLRSATIIMDTLPVCQVRQISYSTFSIVDCRPDGETRVIEMDNPACLFLRRNMILSVPCTVMQSPRYPDRRMRVSHATLEPGDRIVLLSDGILHSGLGTREYPLGWREEDFRKFVTLRLESDPDISARRLAEIIVREALRKEPNSRAQDDMT